MDSISTEFIILIGFLWLAGFIWELASHNATMEKIGATYPIKAMKYMVPIVFLFAWPYFYFYGKNV